MKLQQLRYIVEIQRQGLNVSEAAEALYTSQPGISKQVRLLEDELGVAIFERSGKRFTGVTEPGKTVLAIAERILREAENLKRASSEFATGDSGRLVLAATHTQARYALPIVVRDFVAQHPTVKLEMHQGSPTQIAEWVVSGEADIGIATEALDQYPQLITLPVRQWSHCVIAPEGHPILQTLPLSLSELVKWPLITYDTAFTGRSRINRAFERIGTEPNVALTALDADVIKTYVTLGLGLGIISALAFDAQRDTGLVAIDAAQLFESNTTRLALRRGSYLRRYDYDLIALFAPHLSQHVVKVAMQGGSDAYDL
ncbi:CysB family HTH-type transcriptional regulator [Dechloromonas denitrificans]|uniref:CysB family HTH-type transcriptional regulator n=1 Tax=Azonexaceae TaxID=2008795 RepID=UPI001CF8BE15|nr:CysB family HTH-type transcriptional regulator [Dechloromonas denitrificans]UCV02143.1 CysB family HTH-type transcriptional regulator [Dechloromonas denitrificans]UCV06486.1 CysB family HTH-type transcriptional regulator [Dechloromonas denitrificans]